MDNKAYGFSPDELSIDQMIEALRRDAEGEPQTPNGREGGAPQTPAPQSAPQPAPQPDLQATRVAPSRPAPQNPPHPIPPVQVPDAPEKLDFAAAAARNMRQAPPPNPNGRGGVAPQSAPNLPKQPPQKSRVVFAEDAPPPAPKPYDPNDEDDEEMPNRKLMIAGIAVVLAVVAVAGVAVAQVYNSSTILDGVYVGGVSLGGMTVEQATDAIQANVDTTLAQASVPIIIHDVTYTISVDDVGAQVDAATTAQNAFDVGHTGSIVTRVMDTLGVKLGGKSFTLELTLDETALDACLQTIAEQALTLPITAAWERIEDAVLLTMPQSGVDYDRDLVKEQVASSFATWEFTPYTVTVTVEDEPALDLEAIKAEIDQEMVNATYDPATTIITDEISQVTFDLDLANAIIGDGTQSTYTVPLTIVEAEITAESLEALLFRDVLASVSTSLSESNTARTNNVRLAAASINGIVLMPGDEFSYNAALGERTAENGYQEAGAYSNGEVISELGGGICQPSSTLYMAVLRADLKVTARTNHSFTVSYTPLGEDATVSWGAPDFRFQNDTDYPVEIRAWQENSKMYVELIGTNITGKTVEISTEVLSTTAYEVIETVDETLAAGTTVTTQTGSTGYKTVTYKTVTIDGVSTTTEANRSTYSARAQLVSVAAPVEEEPDATVDVAGDATPDTSTDTSTDASVDTSTDTSTDTGTTDTSTDTGTTDTATDTDDSNDIYDMIMNNLIE